MDPNEKDPPKKIQSSGLGELMPKEKSPDQKKSEAGKANKETPSE